MFNNCDNDSKDNEAHLYFDTETGQYDCKKCGEKGNIFTLTKHFGDSIDDIALNPRKSTKNGKSKNLIKPHNFSLYLVEECHQVIPNRIRQYLHARGITDTLISQYKLGWGEFYGKWWITIPIQDIDGNFVFFKLKFKALLNNTANTAYSTICADLRNIISQILLNSVFRFGIEDK